MRRGVECIKGTSERGICAACQRSKQRCDRRTGVLQASKRPRIKAPKGEGSTMDVDDVESEVEEVANEKDRIYGVLRDIHQAITGLTAVAGRLLEHVCDTEERCLMEARARCEAREAGEREARVAESRVEPPMTSTSDSYSTLFIHDH
jgi:hypothetical protein